MPVQTKCPRCARVGFVRVERVIRGGKAARHFYCGACHYTWTVDESDETSN